MLGEQDKQTVIAGGGRSSSSVIDGVSIHELGNVLARSGWMMEVFRDEWFDSGFDVKQVNWVQMNPGGITDWHCHARQTDQLVGVGGNLKLALWDGRPKSPTHGRNEVVRLGAMRPVLVVIPPGVWHGIRNESGAPAGFLNVINELYVHDEPDNYRLSPGASDIPDIL